MEIESKRGNLTTKNKESEGEIQNTQKERKKKSRKTKLTARNEEKIYLVQNAKTYF